MIIDDKTIIVAMNEHPENGFRLLMNKYKKVIYWHIRRIVVEHEDAQDALQETFIRVFRSFHSKVKILLELGFIRLLLMKPYAF